ncbi:hypothetical protein D3C72_417620 [compost metagenome]
MISRTCLPLLLGLLTALSSACAEESDLIGAGRGKRKPTSSPTSEISQGNGTPSLPDNAVTAPTNPVVVRFVTIDPQTLTLNTPTTPGDTPAGLTATASLKAEVILSDGAVDPQGVSWSSTDARIQVSTSGLVSLSPDAEGSGIVRATSVTDPSQYEIVPVTITREGIVRLALQTPSEEVVTIYAYQGSTHVKSITFEGASTEIRLPAGQGYILHVATSEHYKGIPLSNLKSNQLVTLDVTFDDP